MARIVANNIPDEIHRDLKCACIQSGQDVEEWVLEAAREKIAQWKSKLKKELVEANNLQ